MPVFVGIMHTREVRCSTNGCEKLVCLEGSRSDVVDISGNQIPFPKEHGAFTVQVECEDGHINFLRCPGDLVAESGIDVGGKPAVLLRWS